MSDERTSERATGVDPAVHDYLMAHMSQPVDPISAELAAETRRRFGGLAGMNVGEDQGRFLRLLTRVIGARVAVEIGTFTGMSSLWIARGLPDEGRLHCLDISAEYPAVGRPYWERAGVAERISVHVGPAIETLEALDVGPVDLAFVDADKSGYPAYLDALLPRLSPNGVIALDNVLWGTSVLNEPDDGDHETATLRRLNETLARRDDLEVLMLPLGDGLTLVQSRR